MGDRFLMEQSFDSIKLADHSKKNKDFFSTDFK
jgi:hypothetical protein